MSLPGELSIYFDGSVSPRNPGGTASYGWLVIGQDGTEYCRGRGLAASAGSPLATSNFAEWCALGFGLRWLVDQKWSGKLKILGDGQLVIRQLDGAWRCNAQHLARLRQRCLDLIQDLGGDFSAVWIPREKNATADALSKWSKKEKS